MMQKFEVGSRVRVKPEEAEYFTTPWRDRFKRGLTGVVRNMRESRWGVELFIQFEPRRKPKRPTDWGMWLLSKDIELAEVWDDHSNP